MRKKLLLHACCAPCLTRCFEVLSGFAPWDRALSEAPDFELTVFFDNPNIAPVEEYERRRAEVLRYLDAMSKSVNADFIESDVKERRDAWEEGAKAWAEEPEKGARCAFCYRFRLDESFRVAEAKGFDVVATTLTLSPQKNTALVNSEGAAAARGRISYLHTDFKKNGGYQASILRSKELGLYRQDYCGCRYSRRKEG